MAKREDKGDLKNEFVTAAIVEEWWRRDGAEVELLKRPGDYNVLDFDVYQDGLLVSGVECRRNRKDYNQYPTIWISVAKAKQLIAMGLRYQMCIYFSIMFNNGIWIADLVHGFDWPKVTTEQASRGSNPKGGPRSTDNEQVYRLPAFEFQKVIEMPHPTMMDNYLEKAREIYSRTVIK